MIRPQLLLDLNQELIVDNFAGGGGASTGIELALGRHVDHAINHDRLALGMHRINHPQTVHHCEDVFDIDPFTICEGRPVGLAHFSPDCKHFSKAKGGKPLDKRIRGLVLVMLRWAKYGARVMTMENVVEIQTWGPLIRMLKKGVWGWYPDPENVGRTWRAFLDILSTGIDPDHPDLPEILAVLDGSVTKEECVRGFGYVFEYRELRGCDFGSPTIRKRLFMVARRDGRPIVFPEPTHFETAATHKTLAWHTIAECIEWTIPCPSIFLDRQAAKRARCRRPLKSPTLRRIAGGIDRYVLKAKKPFLVSLTHQGGERTESIDEPSRTVTGAHRGEKALVCPVLTEHANSSTQRTFAADEPLRTQCAQVKGGHFALVSGSLVQTGYGERDGQQPRSIDPNKPLGTIVAGGGKHAVVTGTLVHTAHGEADANGKKRGRGARDVNETMPTVLGSPDAALASANLIKLRGTNIGSPADEPIHTISAGGTHHGVVAASIVRHFGESVGQKADAPAPTVMSNGGGKTGVVAAYLAQYNGGFNTNPGHEADTPVSSISSKGSQQQVVACHLTKYYGEKKEGEVRGQTTEEPLHTQPTENRFGMVAASLAAYYSSEQDGQAASEPSRSITTKARLGVVESELIVPEMTEAQMEGARRVAAFLREYGVEFEGEFATVEGYVIVDIGMRMLTPRELFRAQGFGDNYIIDRAWVIDPKTGAIVEVTLTKEQQIRMCGNSVCPQVEAALIRANVPEMAVWFKDEKGAVA